MKLKENFVLRQVADTWAVLPLAEAALDFNGMLTLNEVGAEIWHMLPEVEDEEELVSRLLDIYEVEEDVLRKDVTDFLDSLRKLGIL